MLRYFLLGLLLTTSVMAAEDLIQSSTERRIHRIICDPNQRLKADGTTRAFACWDHFVPNTLYDELNEFLSRQGSTWTLELETWKRLDLDLSTTTNELRSLLRPCVLSEEKDLGWVDRLQKEFGTSYVTEHTESVLAIVADIHSQRRRECLANADRRHFQAFALSARYRNALTDSLREFYASLPKKRQKQYKAQIAKLKELRQFLDRSDPTFEQIDLFFDERSPAELRAETKARMAPEPLREFLMEDPAFEKPFSIDMLLEFNRLASKDAPDSELEESPTEQ